MLAGRDRVDYVATGALPDAADPEWAARVAAHQQRRPARWVTLETLDLEAVLAAPDLTAQELATPVLIDCLSTWLAGVMDECGLWSGPADRRPTRRWPGGWTGCWTRGGRPAGPSSRSATRSAPGWSPAPRPACATATSWGCLNARVAAEGQQVWLCTAGIPRRLR